MEFSFITNNPMVALLAQSAGIERIFIDLERLGKDVRQKGRQLFLSSHAPSDIARLRPGLVESKLMVRIDPPNPQMQAQIDFAIESGADYLMLPYFHTLGEVGQFINAIAGRAHPVLLVETCEAAGQLSELVCLPGLSEVHLGLNDLSISKGCGYLFDLITDGTVGRLCQILREAGIPFGFGGVGSLSRTDLPVSPDLLLACQMAEGATRGWLGRTFRETPPGRLVAEIQRLQARTEFWASADRFRIQQMKSLLFAQIEAASRDTSGRVRHTA